ncbi:MAG: tetratricopeptide repeat protein [Terriglobia bacterium]
MKLLVLLLAGAALHFDITDERGKKPSGVSIEASVPDSDGWQELKIVKAKGDTVIVWPFDGRVKSPDTSGPQPVVVVQGPVSRPEVVAMVLAGELLGARHNIPLDAASVAPLSSSQDVFVKGVALLYSRKAGDAVDPLGQALKDRERQLIRVPSEIYAAAMLYGRALFDAGKFDNAAVAYRKALQQRPSDAEAHRARSEALVRAGKGEAADN